MHHLQVKYVEIITLIFLYTQQNKDRLSSFPLLCFMLGYSIRLD